MKKLISAAMLSLLAVGCAGSYSPEYQRAQKDSIVSEMTICGAYDTHYRQLTLALRGNMPNGVAMPATVHTSLFGEIFPDVKTATIWINTGGFVVDIVQSDVNSTKITERHMDYPFFRKFSGYVNKYADDYSAQNCK
jgi:hypothetical protein